MNDSSTISHTVDLVLGRAERGAGGSARSGRGEERSDEASGRGAHVGQPDRKSVV